MSMCIERALHIHMYLVASHTPHDTLYTYVYAIVQHHKSLTLYMYTHAS